MSLSDPMLELPFHIDQNKLKLPEHQIYINTKFNAIRCYYYQSYIKASTPEKKQILWKEYEHCMNLIKRILSGEMTTKEAMKQLPSNPPKDKALVISHNLLKVCEILFHTAIASIAYIIGMVFGAPLLFLGASSGIAITAVAGLFFAASIYCASVCFPEFKSFDTKHEVRTDLKDLITFFGSKNLQAILKEPSLTSELSFG